MSSTSSLPSWPPALPQERLDDLSSTARDYALSRGLVYRPPTKPTPTSSVVHAPVSLLPSPLPRSAFEEAYALMPFYSLLYARVTADEAWLEATLAESIKGDNFAEGLWNVWQQAKGSDQLQLGLFRSDYLLHEQAGHDLHLKQVEFNTISASFGPLSGIVSSWHRHLAITQPGLLPGGVDALPANPTVSVLARGLAAAHTAYVTQRSAATPVVLFVVQPGERNAFDQRAIEWELSERHSIVVRRATFAELQTQASVSDAGVLTLTSPALAQPQEVSVVYYRSAYGPEDYTDKSAWDMRALLERSAAVKCPTVALQLAGAKRVQQALAAPGVVEGFLSDAKRGAPLAPADVERVRRSFMGMWPLDATEQGVEGARLAREESKRFVLKPMREGGGHNIYRDDIPAALDAMGAGDAQRHILMELIQPPPGLGAYMLRAPPAGEDAATSASAGTVLAEDTVSELGTYGTSLFRAKDGVVDVVHAEAGGHLLRTKSRVVDEGGVATGYSVLDSPLLI